MSIPRAKLLHESSTAVSIPLLIHGQGVFLFESYIESPNASFSIVDKHGRRGLCIDFLHGAVHVTYKNSYEPLVDKTNKSGLVDKLGAYYWFSLDSHNCTLYAGVGEARLETLIYQYKLPAIEEKFLESLVSIECLTVNPMKLIRDPVTSKIPLLIKNTDDLTMDDIATGNYLPRAGLSPVAQTLYDCVAGKKFILDDADFPEFSAAIEHSIRTPGCWCNRRLAEKAVEFSKTPAPLETYLRITLGQNNGESPGVPYVMEIWPIGHYSPIHNHAYANAVIRVLHGNIHVELFPFLWEGLKGVQEFATGDFVKDDVTWLSPTLNQVHRLTNLPSNKSACVTIQCYMYDENNDTHYNYFDFLGTQGKKQQYTPDSDMEFMAFKALMRREWLEFLGRQNTRHTVYNPDNN